MQVRIEIRFSAWFIHIGHCCNQDRSRERIENTGIGKRNIKNWTLECAAMHEFFNIREAIAALGVSMLFIWYLIQVQSFVFYFSFPVIWTAPCCLHSFFLFSVPGIIGCLQALEAIKIASVVGEPLSGRMLLFDALAARIRIVRFMLCTFKSSFQYWNSFGWGCQVEV